MRGFRWEPSIFPFGELKMKMDIDIAFAYQGDSFKPGKAKEIKCPHLCRFIVRHGYGSEAKKATVKAEKAPKKEATKTKTAGKKKKVK